MKILVCGDRNWKDEDFLFKVLSYERNLWASVGLNWRCVIEGDAEGADRMAGKWAASRGIQPVICPALWEFYGKRAGPMRNSAQWYLQPDYVYAFHSDIESSKGTKHMLSLVKDNRFKLYTGREVFNAKEET